MRHPSPRNQSGSYLVLALPVLFMIFALLLFVEKLNGLASSVERLEITADATLASAFIARAESLETLAAAWDGVRPLLVGATNDEASIYRDSWDVLRIKTSEIKKSLPGYKGRIKSVLTVAGEANDIDRSRVIILNGAALDLGVDTLSQWVRDDLDHREKVSDLILRRLWSPGFSNSQPVERAEILVKGAVRDDGGIFFNRDKSLVSIDRHSAGRLTWNVDPADEFVRHYGNGGYPLSWRDALRGSAVQPHRYPYYSFRMEAP